ncbi:MAG: DNA damage-inducible protein D [Firmicutes bacterium]|nr:DNA damage-inducible protein D [Bacillota bacterium]
MDKCKLYDLMARFDEIAQRSDDGTVEYWTARDLYSLLGYTRWESFPDAIGRAVLSCEAAGFSVEDHFREVPKMIELGKSARREVPDYHLTRYACYLIAQNGDPRKEEIAFAQCYFAFQTRRMELIEDRMELNSRMDARGKLREAEKRLSQNIFERGVDDAGFGRIRSKGDKALFGGHSTEDMKNRLGVGKGRPLADFLPTLTIAAKNLATEMTNHNVEENDLQGEPAITGEHIQNNRSVRDMLIQRGIEPETLPPAEDIKKLERRVKTDEKKLAGQSGRLPKPGAAPTAEGQVGATEDAPQA